MQTLFYLCLLYVVLTVCINFILLCRYCKKAKAVFRELNQKPHVVELDERGILPMPLVAILTFPLSIPTCLRFSQLPKMDFSN